MTPCPSTRLKGLISITLCIVPLRLESAHPALDLFPVKAPLQEQLQLLGHVGLPHRSPAPLADDAGSRTAGIAPALDDRSQTELVSLQQQAEVFPAPALRADGIAGGRGEGARQKRPQ